jgi:nucleotide-binding universal stress UspA family protein
MFRTIVWATDGSEAADRALPFARELASGDGAKLIVVHCNELAIGRAGGYPVLADEDDLAAKIRRQVAALDDEGVDATLELVTGVTSHSAHMIAQVAREVAADVIVVGTRGHAPVAGLLLGSVTQRLLHIAPCPVLAVPVATLAVDRQPAPTAAAAGS